MEVFKKLDDHFIWLWLSMGQFGFTDIIAVNVHASVVIKRLHLCQWRNPVAYIDNLSCKYVKRFQIQPRKNKYKVLHILWDALYIMDYVYLNQASCGFDGNILAGI